MAAGVGAAPDCGAASTLPAAAEQARQLGPIATPLNFAFLDAYFFGLQALFRRCVWPDLGPNAFLAFSHRIILSAIGIWVIVVCFEVCGEGATQAVFSAASLSKAQGLLVVAFTVGVFPRTLWQIITAALTKLTYVMLAVPSVEARQPLDHLDGLTIWHESRLEIEDIENVPNMASADMVDLVLHTQTPAERLVDRIDQAIRYRALGPEAETDFTTTRRGKLRAQGNRTATQFIRINTNPEDTDPRVLDPSLGDGQSPGVARKLAGAIQIEANWDHVAAWRDVERPSTTPPPKGGASAKRTELERNMPVAGDGQSPAVLAVVARGGSIVAVEDAHAPGAPV